MDLQSQAIFIHCGKKYALQNKVLVGLFKNTTLGRELTTYRYLCRALHLSERHNSLYFNQEHDVWLAILVSSANWLMLNIIFKK